MKLPKKLELLKLNLFRNKLGGGNIDNIKWLG